MKIKNTIIIWDGCGDGEPIKFFATSGDYTRLHGTMINGSNDERKVEALNEIIFDDEGEYLIEPTETFPHSDYAPGETAVIVCGFVP